MKRPRGSDGMSLHRDQMGADYYEGPSLLRSGRKRGHVRELARLSATLALVSLLLALLLSSVALGFSDVPVSHPFATAIEDLTGRGIINGFHDGTFRPAAPVTRQQFAKMIVGALYLPASTADQCPFPDVVSSQGANLYSDHLVAVAAENRITEGYSDGTFAPYKLITRAHVVTMVVRALIALDPAALRPAPAAAVLPEEWEDLSGEHRDNARLAYENGLLEGLDLESASKDPLEAMPRGEVAQVLYNMKVLLPEIPAFEWSIEQVDESLKAQMQESGSWKPGVPISFDELRLIHVSFWGFDAKPHTGRLVVNHAWAEELCTVFRALYEARFPIRSMNLIDDYGASDKRSMAADNSSAYNGRFRGGTNVWSMHAYGLAIDIDPIENPWVHASGVSPDAGRAYLDRSLTAPGVIRAGDVVVRAFASIGWKWGGYWEESKDYQHFSSNGQ